ncbi:MAG: malto-oligosyltrehalose synthase [Nitrospirota bacterium]
MVHRRFEPLPINAPEVWMLDKDRLGKLSGLCGISAEYRDIWGNLHAITEETRLSILVGMGYPVSSPEELEAAIEERASRQWSDVLPPVLVFKITQKPRVTITLPEVFKEKTFRWRFEFEGGGVAEGVFNPLSSEPFETGRARGTNYYRYILPLQINDPQGVGAPEGYHKFYLLEDGPTDRPQAEKTALIIVAPESCYIPEALGGDGRIWGVAAQLYALRSKRNWGIGDFTDLKEFMEFWARQGAGMVKVNPLHALFPHRPDKISPYAPSSRLFLNVMYIDALAVEDFGESEEAREIYNSPDFQATLKSLRGAEILDYSGVSAAKLSMFEVLYRNFRERHLNAGGPRAEGFRQFQRERGDPLFFHCLFDAINEKFILADPGVGGWKDWPEEYSNPHSEAVKRFAAENTERVEFYEYMQWQAHIQLESAGRLSMMLGLGVGLYQDLAVGCQHDGSDTWMKRELYATGILTGSPPDDFSLGGQTWGIQPVNPHKLKEERYAYFIESLREAMRSTGALRIDHIMSLARLFWVPADKSAVEGAYVDYPLEDLLGILALESRRNRCLIIGEDLGTVPANLPPLLKEYGIFSYRVFYNEQDEKGFKPPSAYPKRAVVAVNTHDLPTLIGYWQGRDLSLRREHNGFPSEEVRERQVLARSRDRAAILMALENQGLLPEGSKTEDPSTVPEMSEDLILSIHEYLARTPSKLFTVSIDDVTGETEQVNLPGTEGVHNWCGKLSLDMDEMVGSEFASRLAAMLREERRIKVAAPAEMIKGLRPEIPRATYRLQFNAGFRFVQAAEIIPYLSELGVSHCYSSPCFRTRKGSLHGYDIIDHNSLNPEIGSWEEYGHFVGELKNHGMGQILDLVPNHMAVMGDDNLWWLDVLENGQASVYAGFFDIDWQPVNAVLRGKIHIPVLEDHYGNVLEKGELKLVFNAESGEFSVYYYNNRFPIDPMQYPAVLGYRINLLEGVLGPDNPLILEFQSLITSFGHLPSQREKNPARLMERNRDKEIYKKQLAGIYSSSREIASFMDGNVREYQGETSRPESFGLLHELLERQAYRLAYWRVASDEINYRRFFDINEMAGLRAENPQVFERTHELVLRLISEGKVQGLRVDHPDGLLNPLEYFQRLQARIAEVKAVAAGGPEMAKALLEETGGKPFYVVAEKILAGHERLPGDWPVHGTTGYDFTRLVDGIFVDQDAEKKLGRVYARFIGYSIDWDMLVYDRKKLIMRVALASELNVLANMLSQISDSDIHTRDFTLNNLRDAIKETVACFPVYRTYVGGGETTPEDKRDVDWAINLARKRTKTADVSVFGFIQEVMLSERAGERTEYFLESAVQFVMKLQQFTSPVTAKGLEDTAFYIYNRLISLNEVGGDPSRFGVSVQAFHHANIERGKRFPHSMLSTSTHDSKRSADVRMRLMALSEFPREWRDRVARWSRLNENGKKKVDGRPAPARNDEYMFYQTLLGAWPAGGPASDEREMGDFEERICAYMVKAAREAKVHMSWINPNPQYEQALVDFVRYALNRQSKNIFLEDFMPFQKKISRLGMYNSLSQLLLKLTSPGVPDIYQGDEIWDYNLVDPDNRRPVDYGRRREMLDGLKKLSAEPEFISDILSDMEDGRVKMYVIWRVLSLRRERDWLFKEGDYQKLNAEGPRSAHVCAFARVGRPAPDGQSEAGLPAWVIVIAPRLFGALTEMQDPQPVYRPPVGSAVWAGTAVEAPPEAVKAYRNIFTGKTAEVFIRDGKPWIALEDALRDFPVAVLIPA